MPDLLAYPLTVRPDGTMNAIEDLTEPYLAQEIALMILTYPGERPLVPDYGTDLEATDEVLDGLILSAKMEDFGVPVSIGDITRTFLSDDRLGIQVDFDIVDPEDEDIYDDASYVDDVVQPYDTPELS